MCWKTGRHPVLQERLTHSEGIALPEVFGAWRQQDRRDVAILQCAAFFILDAPSTSHYAANPRYTHSLM